MGETIRELGPEDLENRCDPGVFEFQTTAELKDSIGIIDQERAVKSLLFGLGMKNHGYNVYVSGPVGTRRAKTIFEKVRALAAKEPVPDDICYLHNFSYPDEPIGLKLPAGSGKEFQSEMARFAESVEAELQKAFSSDDYERRSKEISERAKSESERLGAELREYAESRGFTIEQILGGVTLIPLKEGTPIAQKEYAALSDHEKEKIERNEKAVKEKLMASSQEFKGTQKAARESMQSLDERIAREVLEDLLRDLKRKYRENQRILAHFDQIVRDVIEHLDLFKKEEKMMLVLGQTPESRRESLLDRCKVNLLVDNAEAAGAPVIEEPVPHYQNLVGKIEHRAQMGVLTTDFMMIKSGAVHRANGGYLVLHAMDVLTQYLAWDALKKILKHRKVHIESLGQRMGLLTTETLKPEPIPIDVKVIMIGSPRIYHLLYFLDEDFRKLFKIKADFDLELVRNDRSVELLALYVANRSAEEELLPFSRDAVAAVVDFSSRLAEHKGKLSARFLDIEDIIREADHWARTDDADRVERKHVQTALDERIQRSNLIEEKIREHIRDNTLLIDTEGEVAGQINGLSIADLGDYSFGRPSRITARTYAGKGDVIDIEREAELGGRLHSKGVMILSGFLGDLFGQDKPLTFSASVCFEQSYAGVEGDSASSAELYCILSSLADLPLRQEIAVTGSVNQKGEIQPVGGINDKIEGFYFVCREKGLSGRQGVMIPWENQKNLMLKREIIESVRKRQFHIFAVRTVNEGIELLTGVESGRRGIDGRFPEQTVYGRVDAKLRRYAGLAKKFGPWAAPRETEGPQVLRH